MSQTETLPPPSKALLLLELRALHEFGAFLGSLPMLALTPHGDGHPVIVFPGLLTGDEATRPLRHFLGWRGYDVHGWSLGRNRGLKEGLEERMRKLVVDVSNKHNRKVSLVGWSLGGVYARELAKQDPDRVRCVITLGSPFAGTPKSTNAWRLYELASGTSVDDARSQFGGDLSTPPPVPTTAIFSRTDGICAWQGCMEKSTAISESIEVEASHCGMGAHPAVAFAVADRLAQPEGRWQPFSRSGWRAAIFPDPVRA
jgi:pimeloyl-ACP methyl ester carboxylesterase